MRSSLAVVFVLAILCSCVLGCGGGSGPSVTGTVTSDGQSLANGLIHFEPLTAGVANASTPVVDGQYEFAPGALAPSTYKVSITSASAAAVDETDPNAMMDQASKPPVEEVILPKFNTNTELRAEVNEGPNQFDFQVSTK